MDHSLKIGVSFGITSAIITTLGLIVGLNAGTSSELVVMGGILTIAIADAFSDALGIHISEESENVHTTKEIWTSTLATFAAKFFFALTFIIPVLLFKLYIAIIVNVAWGLCALAAFSYYIARKQKGSPWKAVFEHVSIGVVVIVVTNFVGGWIGSVFS